MRELIEEARIIIQDWGSGPGPWRPLDTKKLYDKKEQTMAVNTGQAPVPLGGMLRKAPIGQEIVADPDSQERLPKARKTRRRSR